MSTEGKPLVFEIESAPTTMGLLLKQLVDVSYTDFGILGLILFHMCWFVLHLKARNHLTMTSLQFMISCYSVYITQSLNSFMSDHWQMFGMSKNYFDSNCTFAFLFWALPMSILCVLIILGLFVDLCKSIAVHRYFESIMSKKHTIIEEHPKKD